MFVAGTPHRAMSSGSLVRTMTSRSRGYDGDVPVDHVACARGCRRQHAYASARFSVERQLGHEIARQKARKSGLPVPTSPNLSYDGRARGESEVAAIRRQEDHPRRAQPRLQSEGGPRGNCGPPHGGVRDDAL